MFAAQAAAQPAQVRVRRLSSAWRGYWLLVSGALPSACLVEVYIWDLAYLTRGDCIFDRGVYCLEKGMDVWMD